MKTRSTSRGALGEERRSAANAQSGAQLKQATAATMPDARASSLAQLQHQERASGSSQAAQLKALADVMAGRGADAPVQRVEDEELLQGKFEPVQRMDEEEPLQGKFDALQRKEAGTPLQGQVDQSSASVAPASAPVQRVEKPNDTGLPNQLKAGIESLSGMSMDHVKVHYNSDKPAQLQAHAYAQGSEIHVAPGQEQHVPHEAWHIVQQAQGRVRPTLQMKGEIAVNDDVGLELEADSMGGQALRIGKSAKTVNAEPASSGTGKVLQSVFKAAGEKRNKIRKWIGRTKEALREWNEDLLLGLFIRLATEDKETEWDIRETFAVTRLKLKQLLDEEDGPITTIYDEEQPTVELRGARSNTGYKRLAAWDLGVDRGALDPTTHTEFSHVTTSVAWMDKRIDTMHGAASGELGAGFYTVSGHGDVGAKAIRDEFGKTGNVPREVLKFRIENAELGALVDGDMGLAGFLVFVLQNSAGYPPGANHMALINRINRIGKALIFPDKTTLVDIDAAGTQYSYDTYRAANGAPGGHNLIIGPQARPSLDGIRQIAARGYLGDKILNEAARSKSKLGPLNS